MNFGPHSPRRPSLVVGFVTSMIALAGCTYRPARFRQRPPVTDARDTGPIPTPAFRWIPEAVYLSEVYLHRPIRGTLDLEAFPPGGDVNSMDEVPYSSWFVPRHVDIGAMARGADGVGPPRPPFTVLGDRPRALSSLGFTVSDARGERYEMVIDPPDRPEMRTGATAIAARLAWALGFYTPEAYISYVRPEHFWRSEAGTPDVLAMLTSGAPPVLGSFRVTALSLPPSFWLGYAEESGTRGDDPNDIVAHEDRRLLRSLKVFASWMSLSGLGPSKTMDRYVGAPGEGHVVHFLVGLDDALGADEVVRVTDLPPGEGGGSPFVRLVTLGLAPNPARRPTQVEIPALGQLQPEVDPGEFAPSTPYAPIERLTPADAYWAAKRVAALSAAHIALAIEAGKFSDRRARQEMQTALEARRERVASYWFERVTPIELRKIEGTQLTLRDEAIHNGWARVETTDYYVDFLTDQGTQVGDPLNIVPQGDEFHLTLPQAALDVAEDYLVVRIIARRHHVRAPRALTVHLRLSRGKVTLLGLRH
jgi:hypothetical protein